MEAYTLVVPLYNPFDDIITLNVKINGQYLEGEKKINIKPKEKFKYLLEFNPIQMINFRINCFVYQKFMCKRININQLLLLEIRVVRLQLGQDQFPNR
jgi:hypothetical protein